MRGRIAGTGLRHCPEDETYTTAGCTTAIQHWEPTGEPDAGYETYKDYL